MTVQRSYHSRYAPQREAERFIEASLNKKMPGTILLLGPGENYIGRVLAERYPWALVYSMHPEAGFIENTVDTEYQWWPESPVQLAVFLRKALFNEQTTAGVAVLEWEPVMSYFPEAGIQIRNSLTRALASAAADRATVSYWSANWLKNCLKFAARIKNPALPSSLAAPIIVCAAGPGLSACYDFIRSRQKNSSVWALASAVPALLHAGIQADVSIATDPGYWSGVHLRHSLQAGIPVALPPSAYAGTGLLESGLPIIPLNTGLIFERLILQLLGLRSTEATAFGTSAGTALSLALKLTAQPVYVCGLDLAAAGVKIHAEPYAFDILHELKVNRTQPIHSQRYNESINVYPEKSGIWRFSRAFSAYANELYIDESELGRIKRFTQSPVQTGGLENCWPPSLSEVDSKPTLKPLLLQQQQLHAPDARACSRLLDQFFTIGELALRRAGKNKKPLSFDESLTLKALCGAATAPALALAARGQLEQADLDQGLVALEAARPYWEDRCR
ncbi:MAG: DUF115 domain-containing protein [Spirochaetes bacterium]|nr:DUF115 domain-containing protein [Spirochaetota bacterium]MBU0955589.1 DUF115 domain-containing protein [Spirochaetota bacterium]